ncbi:hypothetical protein ACEWY4_018415 [Coilia grayii]|uniref:G-protein coupled receptors family 1 profile domain-containing protein n=1 Tax=Coilia grayii TaxID=363190 RepID=A0ABD1JFE8_9TELE
MNASVWNSSAAPPQVCVREARVSAVLFPLLYALLLLGGLLLNGLALRIFTHIRSTSTFLVYMKNLLAADLLMVLTLPVRLLSDAGLGGWSLRAVHCRYTAVLFYVSMYISILLLGLISLDRYLKVVLPFWRCALLRVPVGRTVCAVIWATMLALALPNMLLSNQMPNQEPRGRLKCSALKSPTGLKWHEGFNYFCQVLFWGTLLVMIVCYTFISRKVYQSYRTSHSTSRTATHRTKAKVFVVVGVFFVCFAPFHFARVPYTLSQTRGGAAGAGGRCWLQGVLYGVKEATLWLCTTNVCLDPLIYVHLCRTFRHRLLATLRRQTRPSSTMDTPTETSTRHHPPISLKPLPSSTMDTPTETSKQQDTPPGHNRLTPSNQAPGNQRIDPETNQHITPSAKPDIILSNTHTSTH